MQQFDESTGWESARTSVLFTVAALEASGQHTAQLRAMRTELGKWDGVESARRVAMDETVKSNAVVSVRDTELDDTVKALGSVLLNRPDGTKDEVTFKAYFEEPVSEVTRMSLETEVARCAKFATVRQRVALTGARQQAYEAVMSSVERGKEAIALREKAAQAKALAALDMERWKKDANAVRVKVYLALQTWGVENGRGREYADAFFPEAAPRRKKKAESKPDPA